MLCGRRNSSAGFTLIEVLIDVAIVTLITATIFSAFSGAFKSVGASKAKITAVSIASERMEIIRNMPYDSIGTTTSSYPPGQIPSEQTVVRNDVNFIINTYVNYVDDASDGTISTIPMDTYPYDYKRVEVRVRRSSNNINLATLTTDIAGEAAETSSNTGILYFCAKDANSQPVAEATLSISNEYFTPELNMSFLTGGDGCVMVPKLPPDTHNHYHLEVTKDGYSTAVTYPRTAQNPNELYANVDITVQQVTRVTLSIDELSTLTIRALDMGGNPVPNLGIHLQDDYEIYFNPSTMRYSEDLTLDASGTIILSDMAYANYDIAITTDGYYYNSSDQNLPFYLEPNIDGVITLYVTNSNTAPSIRSVNPISGKIVDATTVMVKGSNFQSSTTMKIVNPSTGIEIIASDIQAHAGDEISGVFDLTQGSIGKWDLYIQNPNNELARKVEGFEITN